MSALAQQLVSGMLVLMAAAYATWSLWLRRRWRVRQAAAAAAAGEGPPVDAGGCGCSGCDVPAPGKPARG